MEEEEESNSTKLSSIGSKHLSELESSSEEEDRNARDDDDDGEEEKSRCSNTDIIKELKNIQKQNTITHCLLTASILITVAWQLSEFSLILRIKQGFNNPLKSIGGAIKGLFNTSIQKNDQKQTQVTPPTYLPGLKIPDFPGFDTSNEEDDDD